MDLFLVSVEDVLANLAVAEEAGLFGLPVAPWAWAPVPSDPEVIERAQLERAMEESLHSYKHAEKKDITLDVKTVEFSKTKKKVSTCAVCQDDFKDITQVVVLRCQHYFCAGCISEWGCYKPECPVCKKEIPVLCGHGTPPVCSSSGNEEEGSSGVSVEEDE